MPFFLSRLGESHLRPAFASYLVASMQLARIPTLLHATYSVKSVRFPLPVEVELYSRSYIPTGAENTQNSYGGGSPRPSPDASLHVHFHHGHKPVPLLRFCYSQWRSSILHQLIPPNGHRRHCVLVWSIGYTINVLGSSRCGCHYQRPSASQCD